MHTHSISPPLFLSLFRPAPVNVFALPPPPIEQKVEPETETQLPPGSYPLVNLVDQTTHLKPEDLRIQENNSANVQLFLKNDKGCTFAV